MQTESPVRSAGGLRGRFMNYRDAARGVTGRAILFPASIRWHHLAVRVEFAELREDLLLLAMTDVRIEFHDELTADSQNLEMPHLHSCLLDDLLRARQNLVRSFRRDAKHHRPRFYVQPVFHPADNNERK